MNDKRSEIDHIQTLLGILGRWPSDNIRNGCCRVIRLGFTCVLFESDNLSHDT